jgi:hypothetical protein
MMAVFVLVLINSMGIFGFLSKAHIEQEVINSSQASLTEIVTSKIDNENAQIKDLQRQIDQLDNSLQKLTEQGKAQTAISQANATRKSRDGLEHDKEGHLQKLQDLTAEKITADAANSKLKAEFGPLQYIADFVYGNPTPAQLENTVRWIISTLVFVFDPLAIVLLVSAQFSFMNRKKKELKLPENRAIQSIDENLLKG